MRLRFWTLCSLALCAAAAAAAMAHVAIDVIGDFALRHDSYDNLAHGSRELVTAVALLVALTLALRGLKNCCEIAAHNRRRVARIAFGFRQTIAYLVATVLAGCAAVPAMEWLDARADGVTIDGLSDAFGGSVVLGLITTVACAAVVATLVFALARWLISNRESIAAIIETMLRRTGDSPRPSTQNLDRERLTFADRVAYTLRFSKRGPPVALAA
ncbi:MAG TPA: hypothetical protein VHS56_08615 [Candidatus Cybelea sp.]|nr:hypothetical protein [Candidatus Cybelea sp.]